MSIIHKVIHVNTCCCYVRPKLWEYICFRKPLLLETRMLENCVWNEINYRVYICRSTKKARVEIYWQKHFHVTCMAMLYIIHYVKQIKNWPSKIQKYIWVDTHWINKQNKHQNTISYNILMSYILRYVNIRPHHLTMMLLSGRCFVRKTDMMYR